MIVSGFNVAYSCRYILAELTEILIVPSSNLVIYVLVCSLHHCPTHVGITFSARDHSQLCLLLEHPVPICTSNSVFDTCTFRDVFRHT